MSICDINISGRMEKTSNDPYETLANAIISTAAEDYVKAYKAYLHRVSEEKQFVQSELYKSITNYSGEYMIDLIRQSVSKDATKFYHERVENSKAEVEYLEHFFRSEYYDLLTGLDGELLIDLLKRKAKKEVRDYKCSANTN